MTVCQHQWVQHIEWRCEKCGLPMVPSEIAATVEAAFRTGFEFGTTGLSEDEAWEACRAAILAAYAKAAKP